MRKNIYIVGFVLFGWVFSFAQNSPYTSSSIRHQMQLFGKAGKVLYLAAHPDDENTRVITWLANAAGVETAYLSLTRGDGGQNLIGSQLGDALGVIRTQELLEARRIDGGSQFFARAVDFGYSKSAEESLEKWGHEEILADVVLVIRKFKPDVIINRFPPDRRAGHGHHEASAILAEEAFEAAADPNFHPESAKKYGVWQVKNIFWNTSTWWVTDLDTSRVGKGSLLHLDVGGYQPLLGKNLGELASESRSMHKSQGFGIARLRGKIPEYLELVKGDSCYHSIFDHVDTTLNRIGASNLSATMRKIIRDFDDHAPWKSVTALVALYPEVENISDKKWQELKRKQLDNIVLNCLGFHAEMLAEKDVYRNGDWAEFSWEIVNRSPVAVSVDINGKQKDLPENHLTKIKDSLEISGGLSHPFYLKNPYINNMFDIANLEEIPYPELPPANQKTLSIFVAGFNIDFQVPLMFKWTDRVKGERLRNVEVVPPVYVHFSETNIVLPDGNPHFFTVEIEAATDDVLQNAELRFNAPEGFTITPESIKFSLFEKGGRRIQQVKVQSMEKRAGGEISASLLLDGKLQTAYGKIDIDFDHIRPLRMFPRVNISAVSLPLQRKVKRIGYILGAGDAVPEALQKIGYEVEIIDKERLSSGNLSDFDAIVAGIRAYNTNPWLKSYQSTLDAYVRRGGRYIIQYNTTGWRSAPEKLTGWDLAIGRSRVTVEESPVKIIDPSARVWNKPNKITTDDFANWVQERGLYFAENWSEEFMPLLEMQDPNEDPVNGALVVGRFGKGYVIYTGISFFRQLPAGVPGAYRLFVNILEYAD
ncbi:MAG: PIG-L family deacetylase [Cryomorphaceae bacterium]|nr:PIG-L family deacetylase [Cryomorphaceae bacterium]